MIWSLSSGKLIGTLIGHTDSIATITISQNDKFFITRSDDKTIKIWIDAFHRWIHTNIQKRVYPHCLRASFATHLIDQGEHLGDIKELLGHSNIRTTYGYIRPNFSRIDGIRNPLDLPDYNQKLHI